MATRGNKKYKKMSITDLTLNLQLTMNEYEQYKIQYDKTAKNYSI